MRTATRMEECYGALQSVHRAPKGSRKILF